MQLKPPSPDTGLPAKKTRVVFYLLWPDDEKPIEQVDYNDYSLGWFIPGGEAFPELGIGRAKKPGVFVSTVDKYYHTYAVRDVSWWAELPDPAGLVARREI